MKLPDPDPMVLERESPLRTAHIAKQWKYEPKSFKFQIRALWYQLRWSRLDIADKLAITCFCASLFGALAGVAIALAVVN